MLIACFFASPWLHSEDLVPALPSVLISDLRIARWSPLAPEGGIPPGRFPSYEMRWDGQPHPGFGVEGEKEKVPSTIVVPLRGLPPGAYVVWVGTAVPYDESVPYDRMQVRIRGAGGGGDASFKRISNYAPRTERLADGLIREDLVGVYKFEIDVPSPQLEMRWYPGRTGRLNYVRVTPLLPLEFGWWQTMPGLQILPGNKPGNGPVD